MIKIKSSTIVMAVVSVELAEGTSFSIAKYAVTIINKC